ncbi:MAG: cytochrome P450 [Monoraphidium minutum]|nr:MAG: cytochrome P450 [Monoraphidium minutum]
MPGRVPVLGHMLFLDAPTAFKQAEAAMRAADARMMTVSLLGRPDSVILRHPDDCAAVARDEGAFTKAGTGWRKLEAWLGHGLVSDPDAAHHAAVRGVLAPAFKAAAVRGFAPLFAEVGEELAAALQAEAAAAGGRAIDARGACRRATLDVIGRAAFGYDFGALRFAAARAGGGGAGGGADAEIGDADCDVVSLFDAVLMPAMLLLFELPLPQSLIPGIRGYHRHADQALPPGLTITRPKGASISKLDAVVDRILKAKRAAGADGAAAAAGGGGRDILSFMLRAQAEGSEVITDRQIRDELHTFMFAGSDTTAGTLAFALYELSRHPDVQAAAAAEARAALPALAAPGGGGGAAAAARTPLLSGVARRAVRGTVVGGHTIAKGSIVLPSPYGAQRHPAFWPRPDEWLPARWLPENAAELAPHADTAWFPFSQGPRSCIGKYFALQEMQVLLAVLLARLSFGRAEGYEADTVQSFTLSTPLSAARLSFGGAEGYEADTVQSFTLSTRGGALVVPAPRP